MKRLFDISLSLSGLILTSPIFLLLAALIKNEDGGSVFYKGVRVGMQGVSFKMFKFRTMMMNADKMGASSTVIDDPRLTKVGKFLRKYKLDELPQLLNVLRGEMSFVGPRPQVPWAVALYSSEEKLLLSVKPGITDYASVKFKNESEILKGSIDPDKDYLTKIAPEKNRLALEYVKSISLQQDIKIIFLTIKSIFLHNA